MKKGTKDTIQWHPPFRHTKYQATMQSGELESGLPDEAEQESIVAWYFCGVL